LRETAYFFWNFVSASLQLSLSLNADDATFLGLEAARQVKEQLSLGADLDLAACGMEDRRKGAY
jgi:hypothetical protein